MQTPRSRPGAPLRRRPPWLARPLGILLLASLALLALAMVPAAADARPSDKYTLGIGLAGARIKGDLDGQAVASDDLTTGPNAYLAKPDEGGGMLLFGGLQFSRLLAVEVLSLSTRHDATHAAYPGVHFQSNVGSLLAALRVMGALGENVEVFGRVGAGTMGVVYADNTVLPPNALRLSSKLAGWELAAGGGLAVFFDPLGVELGLLHERGRLRHLSAAERTVDSFRQAYVTRNTVTLALTMHFRGGA